MLRKILVADDNVTVRKQLEQLLQSQGYDVMAVGNGDLALAKTPDFQPHIILLDVIMPGKTGYEVCHQLKSDARFSQIPIILTFSDIEPFDPAEARRAGATRCLPKTVEPDQLLSILDFIWAGVTPVDYSAVSTTGAQTQLASDEVNLEPEFEPDNLEIEPVNEYEDDGYEEEYINSDYRFEVKLEDTHRDLPELEEAEEPSAAPLQLHTEHTQVEIPGLESPVKKAPANFEEATAFEPEVVVEPIALAAAASSGNGSPDSYDQVLDTTISEEHFKNSGTPEENPDDPLQIKEAFTTNQCRECGATVVIGDVFCIECGAAVDEAVVQAPADLSCEQCGEAIHLGDVFCLNCGAVQ